MYKAIVGLFLAALSMPSLAGVITQTVGFDFSLVNESVGPSPFARSRNTTESLGFNQYDNGGSLQSVTLAIDSALWHQTSVDVSATNSTGSINGVVLFATATDTNLNVGMDLPTSTGLLTANDLNTVACNETRSSVLPGNSVECSDRDGHFKGPVTFPLPTGGFITINVDNEIDHIMTVELTGSAMNDFVGSGIVNVDMYQNLGLPGFFCSAAGFDLSCSLDWSSRWYGDMKVTYVDEATPPRPVPVPAPRPCSWQYSVWRR